MSQASEKDAQKVHTQAVSDAMAYEAYKALLGALGGPASRETGLSPEEMTEAYIASVASADLASLRARVKEAPELADFGVTNEDLGQVAYEAYLAFVGGRSVTGQKLLGWHNLQIHIRAAWISSAHAVHVELVQEIRRRIDDLELHENPEFIQGLAAWRAGEVQNADVCSPASGYHSSPHRRCVLREAEESSDLTPPGEWQ